MEDHSRMGAAAQQNFAHLFPKEYKGTYPPNIEVIETFKCVHHSISCMDSLLGKINGYDFGHLHGVNSTKG